MSTEKNPVCGQLYSDILAEFDGTPEGDNAFRAGFMLGQVEKVYLGACSACMFRVMPERIERDLTLAKRFAAGYGLETESFPVEDQLEVWVFRPGTDMGMWLRYPVNSADWHLVRGLLVGIPLREIDHNYHERKGYGKSHKELQQSKEEANGNTSDRG